MSLHHYNHDQNQNNDCNVNKNKSKNLKFISFLPIIMTPTETQAAMIATSLSDKSLFCVKECKRLIYIDCVNCFQVQYMYINIVFKFLLFTIAFLINQNLRRDTKATL